MIEGNRREESGCIGRAECLEVDHAGIGELEDQQSVLDVSLVSVEQPTVDAFLLQMVWMSRRTSEENTYNFVNFRDY